MLRFVKKHGNSTVYEWRTGSEPSVVERPQLEEPPEQVQEDEVRQALGGAEWGSFSSTYSPEQNSHSEP